MNQTRTLRMATCMAAFLFAGCVDDGGDTDGDLIPGTDAWGAGGVAVAVALTRRQ